MNKHNMRWWKSRKTETKGMEDGPRCGAKPFRPARASTWAGI
jgi:hypothetical protein